MIKSLIHAAALLPLATALPAQSILNVERLQPTDVSGLHARLDASASITGGNTEVVDLGGTGIAGYASAAHWVRLLAGATFLSEEGTDLVNDRFAHARYNYGLSSRLRTFHFAQIQTSLNLLLSRRLVAGSGVRWTAVQRARVSLDLGTGVMWEEERLDRERLRAAEGDLTRVLRAANLMAVRWKIRDGTRLRGVTYAQPELGEPDDFRILTDLTLSTALGGGVDLNVTFRWRHDSEPPADLDRNDFTLGSGLELNFP